MSVKINLMPAKSSEGLNQGGQKSFFYLISSIFFIISLLVFSAIFIWKAYFLEKDLSKSKADNEALNAVVSENLKLPSLGVNMKAKGIEKILKNHLYPTKFYALLESLTLKNVSYAGFSMEVDDEGKNVKIKVSGQTDDFKSLAKQLTVFRESEDISSVSFGGAQMDKSGKVSFGTELLFKGSVLKFLLNK